MFSLFSRWVIDFDRQNTSMAKKANSSSESYAADETKLWLSPSVKQRRNPCAELSTIVPGF